MKRHGHKYEEVMTLDNVVKAFDAYNKPRPVCERIPATPELAAAVLDMIQTDFAACIGRPISFHVDEYGHDRAIEMPGTPLASIAMLAVWNVCGPIIENHVHENSFSSRKGKGQHVYAKKVERFVHTHHGDIAKYCLYFDLSGYYMSIVKSIVIDRLEGIFKDARIIRLFEQILYSTPQGLPIGYPFSHALANLYVAPLYCLVRAIRGITAGYVNMDNHHFFAARIAPLKRLKSSAMKYFAGVGCEIKDDWQIFPTAARALKAGGLVISTKGTRLYRGTWHRTMRTFDRLTQRFDLHDYLGMMSRLGLLDLCGRRYAPVFKYEGGYIWQK